MKNSRTKQTLLDKPIEGKNNEHDIDTKLNSLANKILIAKRMAGKYNNEHDIDTKLNSFCNTWPKNNSYKISQFLTNKTNFDNTIQYIQQEYFNNNQNDNLKLTIIRKLLTTAITHHFSYKNPFFGGWIVSGNELSINLSDQLKGVYNHILYDAIFDAALLDRKKNYITLSMQHLKPSPTKEIHTDNCSLALLNHINSYHNLNEENKNDITITKDKIRFAKQIFEFAKSSNYVVKSTGYESNHINLPTIQLLDLFKFSTEYISSTLNNKNIQKEIQPVPKIKKYNSILQNRFLNFVNFSIKNNNIHCEKMNFNEQRGFIYEDCTHLLPQIINLDTTNIQLQKNIAENIRYNLKDKVADDAYRGVKLNLPKPDATEISNLDFLNREAQIIIDAEQWYKNINSKRNIILAEHQKNNLYIAKIIFTMYQNYSNDKNYIETILNNITKNDKERLDILQNILMLTNDQIKNFDIFSHIFQYANFCNTLDVDQQTLKKTILTQSSIKLNHSAPDKAEVVLPQEFFKVVEQTAEANQKLNTEFSGLIEGFIKTNDFLEKFTNDNKVQVSYIEHNWFRKMITFITQPAKTILYGFRKRDFIIKIGKEQYSLKKLVPHMQSKELLDVKYTLMNQYDEPMRELCQNIDSIEKYAQFSADYPELVDALTPIIIKLNLEKNNRNNAYIKQIAKAEHIIRIYNCNKNKLNMNYLNIIQDINEDLLKIDQSSSNKINELPKLFLEDWIITNINRGQISNISNEILNNIDIELKNVIHVIKNIKEQKKPLNHTDFSIIKNQLVDFNFEEQSLSLKLQNSNDKIKITLTPTETTSLLKNSEILASVVQHNRKRYKQKEPLMQFILGLFSFKFKRLLINNDLLIQADQTKYQLHDHAIYNIVNNPTTEFTTKAMIFSEELDNKNDFQVQEKEQAFKHSMKEFYRDLITILLDKGKDDDRPRTEIIDTNNNFNIDAMIEEIHSSSHNNIDDITTSNSVSKDLKDNAYKETQDVIPKILTLYTGLNENSTNIQYTLQQTYDVLSTIPQNTLTDSNAKRYLQSTLSLLNEIYNPQVRESNDKLPLNKKTDSLDIKNYEKTQRHTFTKKL